MTSYNEGWVPSDDLTRARLIRSASGYSRQGCSARDVRTSEGPRDLKTLQIIKLLWIFWGTVLALPSAAPEPSQPCRGRPRESCRFPQMRFNSLSFRVPAWQATVILSRGCFAY